VGTTILSTCGGPIRWDDPSTARIGKQLGQRDKRERTHKGKKMGGNRVGLSGEGVKQRQITIWFYGLKSERGSEVNRRVKHLLIRRAKPDLGMELFGSDQRVKRYHVAEPR